MKLLASTHTFMWWDIELSKLTWQVLVLCQNCHKVLIAQFGQCLGNANQTSVLKSRLTMYLKNIIETQQQTNNIETLSVTQAHVLALESLPVQHRDFLDSLLVAKAMVEKVVLLSGDLNVA